MMIYLAAPWKRRHEAKMARQKLVEAGITVNSRWLDFHGDLDLRDPTAAPGLCAEAMNDYEDVFAADCLLLLNLEASEGKAVETGLALAWSIPVIGVGSPSNVFHFHPGVRWVPTLKEAIDDLRLQGNANGR